MTIYEYDNDGVLHEREATAEDAAAINAYSEEQQRPFVELQEQIDDMILIMAEMIGGE